jgi:hypothetical protein
MISSTFILTHELSLSLWSCKASFTLRSRYAKSLRISVYTYPSFSLIALNNCYPVKQILHPIPNGWKESILFSFFLNLFLRIEYIAFTLIRILILLKFGKFNHNFMGIVMIDLHFCKIWWDWLLYFWTLVTEVSPFAE